MNLWLFQALLVKASCNESGNLFYPSRVLKLTALFEPAPSAILRGTEPVSALTLTLLYLVSSNLTST